MGKGKLQKFAEVNTFPNVLQNFDFHQPVLVNHEGAPVELKGKWAKEFFGNDHPIVLELACGRGEYSLGLSRLFPEKNFIGMDLKGNRIWGGAKEALENHLNNVAFIRSRIDLITNYFDEGEIAEIWITFPDPYVRPSKAGKRLTSPYFLNKYRTICKKDAVVHLKTDSPLLYEFTLETLPHEGCRILKNTDGIYENGVCSDELAIKTYYEKMHLAEGKTIKYIQFLLQ